MADSSNVTGRHRGPKWKLRAGYRAPSRHWRAMCRHSYFHNVAYWTSPVSVRHVIFFIVEYAIGRFLCAMRVFDIRSSSSSPIGYIFWPNFVSFAASVVELAHGEKSRTHSINHPAYLMCREHTAKNRLPGLYIFVTDSSSSGYDTVGSKSCRTVCNAWRRPMGCSWSHNVTAYGTNRKHVCDFSEQVCPK